MIKIEFHNGYIVVGNDCVAIAVNVADKTDSHYFGSLTEDKNGIDMTAFDNAVSWTSPGI